MFVCYYLGTLVYAVSERGIGIKYEDIAYGAANGLSRYG